MNKEEESRIEDELDSTPNGEIAAQIGKNWLFTDVHMFKNPTPMEFDYEDNIDIGQRRCVLEGRILDKHEDRDDEVYLFTADLLYGLYDEEGDTWHKIFLKVSSIVDTFDDEEYIIEGNVELECLPEHVMSYDLKAKEE